MPKTSVFMGCEDGKIQVAEHRKVRSYLSTQYKSRTDKTPKHFLSWDRRAPPDLSECHYLTDKIEKSLAFIK